MTAKGVGASTCGFPTRYPASEARARASPDLASVIVASMISFHMSIVTRSSSAAIYHCDQEISTIYAGWSPTGERGRICPREPRVERADERARELAIVSETEAPRKRSR